jgi:hypothetical protein
MNVGACHTSSPADTTGLGQRRLAFNAQKVALAPADGCISCDPSTKRIVTTIRSNSMDSVKSCSCQPPLEPTTEGCACPTNCTCKAGAIDCNPFSSRFLTNFNVWVCKELYLEVNGSCVCDLPYRPHNITNECQCSSQVVPSKIYKNTEKECVRCPPECICDDVGCTYCSIYSNRNIVGNSCPCFAPYREVMGTC